MSLRGSIKIKSVEKRGKRVLPGDTVLPEEGGDTTSVRVSRSSSGRVVVVVRGGLGRGCIKRPGDVSYGHGFFFLFCLLFSDSNLPAAAADEDEAQAASAAALDEAEAAAAADEDAVTSEGRDDFQFRDGCQVFSRHSQAHAASASSLALAEAEAAAA